MSGSLFLANNEPVAAASSTFLPFGLRRWSFGLLVFVLLSITLIVMLATKRSSPLPATPPDNGQNGNRHNDTDVHGKNFRGAIDTGNDARGGSKSGDTGAGGSGSPSGRNTNSDGSRVAASSLPSAIGYPFKPTTVDPNADRLNVLLVYKHTYADNVTGLRGGTHNAKFSHPTKLLNSLPLDHTNRYHLIVLDSVEFMHQTPNKPMDELNGEFDSFVGPFTQVANAKYVAYVAKVCCRAPNTPTTYVVCCLNREIMASHVRVLYNDLDTRALPRLVLEMSDYRTALVVPLNRVSVLKSSRVETALLHKDSTPRTSYRNLKAHLRSICRSLNDAVTNSALPGVTGKSELVKPTAVVAAPDKGGVDGEASRDHADVAANDDGNACGGACGFSAHTRQAILVAFTRSSLVERETFLDEFERYNAELLTTRRTPLRLEANPTPTNGGAGVGGAATGASGTAATSRGDASLVEAEKVIRVMSIFATVLPNTVNGAHHEPRRCMSSHAVDRQLVAAFAKLLANYRVEPITYRLQA